MSELDQIWAEMLEKARESARASSRHDVADYLDLKASNDLIRRTGVTWLFDTLTAHAGEANRYGRPVMIERTDPHGFSFRGANLSGSLLSFRHGVRCLIAEAGWTRTPADGFMRGGGLAFARLRHFGIPKRNLDLALHVAGGPPVWRSIGETGPGPEVHSDELARHIDLLTDR